jgi:hypothetical protein
MNCVVLTQDEKSELKVRLLKFMYGILDNQRNRLPEEVIILPAIAKLLLNGR